MLSEILNDNRKRDIIMNDSEKKVFVDLCL